MLYWTSTLPGTGVGTSRRKLQMYRSRGMRVGEQERRYSCKSHVREASTKGYLERRQRHFGANTRPPRGLVARSGVGDCMATFSSSHTASFTSAKKAPVRPASRFSVDKRRPSPSPFSSFRISHSAMRRDSKASVLSGRASWMTSVCP
jgi:hypothetical protein